MTDIPAGGDEPTVDGYDELRQIGRGGFATVYRARQTRFDRVVALKVLDLPNPDETARARFDRECRAIGALSWHPNIVVVHDSGTTAGGRLYLAMEYLEAGSLADRVRADGPLPWADVVRSGIEVTGALETAHDAGTLHRDLKPDNLLVGVFGESKLGDFGIAAVEGGPATATGSSALTVLYAAPEVLRGGRGSVASDVYSLASTLYTLLAGHAAYARATDESVAATVLRAVSEPAPDLRPLGVPDDLAAVIEQGMAKEPTDRPATAADFGRALQGVQRAHGLEVTTLRLDPRRAQASAVGGDASETILVSGLPAGAAAIAAAGDVPVADGAPTTPPPPPPPAPDDSSSEDPGPDAPSRRGLVIAGVIVLVLLLGGGAWFAFGRSDDDGSETATTRTTTEDDTTTSTTEASTTTTSAVPSTTVTTARPTTTTTTEPEATTSPFIATTPEEAAEGFLQAWTIGDSEGAYLYAEPEVADELFVRPTGGAGSTFEGCFDNGDATFNCALRFEGGSTTLVVSAPPGGRFRVTAANSIAD